MIPIGAIKGLLASDTEPPATAEDQSEKEPRNDPLTTDGGTLASSGDDDGPSVGSADSVADWSVHGILDHLPIPVFVLDGDHTVIAWNNGAEELYGRPREEMLGSDEYLGRDRHGNPRPTTANKVINDPETVAEGTEDEWQENPWLDQEVLTGTRVIETASGEPRHFRIFVAPVYENGNVVGAVEYLKDRTLEVRRQQSTDEAVDEITTALAEIGAGNLASRVEVDTDVERQLDDHIVTVIEGINRNTAELQELVNEVRGASTDLTETARDTADLAAAIAESAGDQNEMLEGSADEINEFSATMEEVAANADAVANAVESALKSAETGREASERARGALDNIADQGEKLHDVAQELQARTDDIVGVVEIIEDIADETNILALNANIEAARAADGSGGFAVVAEEVKMLAEETKTRTDEIGGHVEDIRSQSEQTTAAVKQTDETIQETVDSVEEVLAALEAVSEAVDEISVGISEVAQANDDQAKTAEQVAAAIDEVSDRAKSVEETSRDIRSLATKQREIADDLATQVDRISDE